MLGVTPHTVTVHLIPPHRPLTPPPDGRLGQVAWWHPDTFDDWNECCEDENERRPSLRGLLDAEEDRWLTRGRLHALLGEAGASAALLAGGDGFPAPAVAFRDGKTTLWDRQEVLRWTDGERFASGAPETLVERADIARLTGLHPDTVSQYVRDQRPSVPAPDGRVGQRLFWLQSTVAAWPRGRGSAVSDHT